MKKEMERLKNERGLTLVELLAVVIILAIIGTIAFVLIGNIIENSKKDAHVANAEQLIHSAKLYEPDTGNALTTIESGTLESEGLLEELINPWNTSDENYKGTVKKNADTGVYTVTLSSGDEALNCSITDVPERVILQGRVEACDWTE